MPCIMSYIHSLFVPIFCVCILYNNNPNQPTRMKKRIASLLLFFLRILDFYGARIIFGSMFCLSTCSEDLEGNDGVWYTTLSSFVARWKTWSMTEYDCICLLSMSTDPIFIWRKLFVCFTENFIGTPPSWFDCFHIDTTLYWTFLRHDIFTKSNNKNDLIFEIIVISYKTIRNNYFERTKIICVRWFDSKWEIHLKQLCKIRKKL